MTPKVFYSHGKLLLCGEYAVLNGATAFALPTTRGQSLSVNPTSGSNVISWKSFDKDDKVWFTARISLPHFIVEETNDPTVAIQLVRFLINARHLNQQFLTDSKHFRVETKLEFSRDEGLGSSSTLTNNIAQWAGINPYQLHFNAFKGSGYDIAVAERGQPLLYTMNGVQPEVETVSWKKPFAEKLFFVHLNQKQDSRSEVTRFAHKMTSTEIAQITRISRLLSINDDYFEFCLLLELAENEMSQILGRPTIKQSLFQDFHGTVKSLGAWGGDYVLATGTDTVAYFGAKGFNRIIPYREMIKS